MSFEFKSGVVFDKRFLLQSMLGEGGMGAVWLAKQLDSGTRVSLKILKSELVTENDGERFLRECRNLAKLSHPHIVMFYHYATSEEGIPYYSSEFIDGVSLRELIKAESKLDWKRVLHIAIQIADALSSAHQIGVLHRDLKPENIMLSRLPEPDWVKVIDFGLSGIISDRLPPEQKLTFTGQILGTCSYMSPEQCMGEKVDQSTDIYALGCIIFECLTGNAPFTSDTPIAIMYKHKNESPVPYLANLPEGVSGELRDLLRKMLSKSVEKRPESMARLRSNFEDILVAPQADGKKRSICAALLLALVAGAFLLLVPFVLKSQKTFSCKNDNEAAKPEVDVYDQSQNQKEHLYKQLIANSEKRLNAEQSASLTGNLEKLADLCVAEGKTDEAHSAYQRALRLRGKEQQTPQYANLLSKMGLLCSQANRLDEAESNYRLALAIYEKLFGPRDAEVAKCLQGLAAIKVQQGRPLEGEPFVLKSLELCGVSTKEKSSSKQQYEEHSVSWSHFSQAKCFQTLAAIRRSQGRLEDCEQLLKRALDIRAQMRIPPTETVDNYLDLADLYRFEGQLDKAEVFRKKAVVIEQSATGRTKVNIVYQLKAYDQKGTAQGPHMAPK